MKKTYDWNIQLTITVCNNQRTLQMACSVHTNIHQLKILIAKQLSLPILDTQIDIYFRNNRPLRSTSTLLQNDVPNHSQLTANIVRTKPNQHLPIEDKQISSSNDIYKKRKGQNKVQNAGLSIISSCTNPNCVNYNQKIEINYGFGTFAILELTAFAKCQVCPYKSQFLRPNMMCHSIKAQRCFYQLKGTALNSCGIPIPHQTNFTKCLGEKQLQKLLEQNPWHINMQLLIKAL